MRNELPRVLVIDDEPAVCRALARMLDRYLVETCVDPFDALERMTTQDFAAILCDIGLPRLSGVELYERAVFARPALAGRFVFLTGGNAAAARFLARSDIRSLQKPFDREVLVAMLAVVTGKGLTNHGQ